MEFQSPNCAWNWYWFLKTILVFSFAQAEQFPEILLERACHIWQLQVGLWQQNNCSMWCCPYVFTLHLKEKLGRLPFNEMNE